ncbi:Clp protease N-terminal domain-containing protein [Pseudofrankia inefficax]|uniref:Clp domain protein n=1 Tax=Pseudofrankia inefficax (strain DSM 45817 / CECT 9037 / DDB 130130 / EuI1c) TaxID=298654 RepID=E3J1L0_PSEI1|nr:Clp protease N-terminal domain-containing protein [Pseudofrankia inefficax]ADP81678.1 Clp domain protein [Pseudofrankia inefficax]
MRPRFGPGAREVIGSAVAEARLRGDRRIGTEHLLLGVLRHPDTAAARALAVDLADARAALGALDREALAVLGIDVSPGLPAPAGGPCLAPGDPWGSPDEEPAAGRLFGGHRAPPSPEQVARLRAALSSGARAVLAGSIGAAPHDPAGRVTPELVLAALLERQPPDPAAALLARLGVDPAVARARLTAPHPRPPSG